MILIQHYIFSYKTFQIYYLSSHTTIEKIKKKFIAIILNSQLSILF